MDVGIPCPSPRHQEPLEKEQVVEEVQTRTWSAEALALRLLKDFLTNNPLAFTFDSANLHTPNVPRPPD